MSEEVRCITNRVPAQGCIMQEMMATCHVSWRPRRVPFCELCDDLTSRSGTLTESAVSSHIRSL